MVVFYEKSRFSFFVFHFSTFPFLSSLCTLYDNCGGGCINAMLSSTQCAMFINAIDQSIYATSDAFIVRVVVGVLGYDAKEIEGCTITIKLIELAVPFVEAAVP